jgi:hypothetical protein
LISARIGGTVEGNAVHIQQQDRPVK